MSETPKASKKKASKKQLSLFLPAELVTKLKVHAAETDRFVVDLVEEYVREGLAKAKR